MRWPLRLQILVPFALIMLGSVIVVSGINAWMAARRTQERIEGQLREVAATLLDATFPLTDAVLEQTRGLSGAQFVLANPSGKILATSFLRSAAPNLSTEASDLDNFYRREPLAVRGELFFHAAIRTQPRDGRSQPAVLHILYPERIWREASRQAAYPPLLVGAGALAVVSLLAVAIAARLSRPMVRLRSQVDQLARGDFQTLPLPQRDDELRDLAISVNSLAVQLAELRLVIQRSERLALLGQLSGGLAHHLRNDVTGARMAVQLHQRRCRDVDPESLAVALRQLTLTEEHLKRFLAAGQPQAPVRTQCDLRQLVAELVTLVEPSCRHRKVELQVAEPGPVRTELFADPEQLRHLMMNLVLNAIDAAGPGGWVRIELADSSAPGASPEQVQLRVLDSGPGPPPELVDRLFEPFTTGKSEGVGLGLAVARQIAVAHGGSLRFDRVPETCFTLMLPVAANSANSASSAQPSPLSPCGRGVGGEG